MSVFSKNHTLNVAFWIFILSFAMVNICIDDAHGQTDDLEPSGPDTVDHGEAFVINMPMNDLIVALEVKYPGARTTWIFESEGDKDEDREFNMAPAYSGMNISYRSLVWTEEGREANWSSGSDWYIVHLTGWIDEDNDGLSDAWEDLWDLDTDDPNEDRDEDGLILLEEMYHLTDPGSIDSDEDNLGDEWEAKWGTIPFKDDTNSDPDGDSWSNIQEMTEKTDPRDPGDHPEEPPVTPWYWIVIIVGALILILAYFVRQLFSKKKLEEDLDDFDRNNRKDRSPRARDISGKI